MGRILGLAASRVFGSRYGIALLLAVVVLAIVGAAKLFAGPAGTASGGLPGGAGPAVDTVASSPAAEDGESLPLPTPTLVAASGAAAPEAVATLFAAAWVHHRGIDANQWLNGLRPHATAALVTKLTGADPEGVPADRVTGAVTLVPRGETFAEAAVPVDSGTLRLRLVATDGHWYVDGVDWERA